MWIDRIEERIDEGFGRLGYPGLWLAGGAMVALVLLFMFGAVVVGQVERSHTRDTAFQQVRSALAQCYEARNGQAVDQCRAMVLAGYPPAPQRRLPQWPETGDLPPTAQGPAGIVPVSLTRPVLMR